MNGSKQRKIEFIGLTINQKPDVALIDGKMKIFGSHLHLAT
jgi:hypothetical protein